MKAPAPGRGRGGEPCEADTRRSNGDANKLRPEDRVVHDWYRFVLSFPPHLVREYVERFGLSKDSAVLDPFCGTGTTLVECKKLGLASTGVEATPMAHFASTIKIDWAIDPDELVHHAEDMASTASDQLELDGVSDVGGPLFDRRTRLLRLMTLPAPAHDLLLTNSISPLPTHKALVLLGCLNRRPESAYRSHELLALARVLVFAASNLRFGPEVGVGKPKDDAPVIQPWLDGVKLMADDLRVVRAKSAVPAQTLQADARELSDLLEPAQFDAVITSPPYPNEKDYTRTTRLESVFLGFLRDKSDLRTLKQTLVRSNTRNVFKADTDDEEVAEHKEIQRLADQIESRRVALGKTSGFERLYSRVAKLYFGGMRRHLEGLRHVVRPGAQLAYVVGDQASYLRVMIRTGQLIADIADSLGYEVLDLDLFRSRFATATGEMLREEVVLLRWPGGKRRSARSVAPLRSAASKESRR